ncbi:MAG: hypothetical protein AAGB31_15640, partial [Bdellovibrio sp.]
MFQNTVIFLTLLLPASAFAQISMWGTGTWGGMQNCNYQVRQGEGATNEDDGLSELQAALKEDQQQLKDKKNEKKKLERAAEKARTRIEKSIAEDQASFIFEHIENERRCDEYKGLENLQTSASPANVSEDERQGPPARGSRPPGAPGQKDDFIAGGTEGNNNVEAPTPANKGLLVIPSYVSNWGQHCDPSKKGSVRSSACNAYRDSEGGRGNSVDSCKKSLTEYRVNYSKGKKLQNEIEDLEERIQMRKEELADAKKEMQELARERRMSQTEGEYCENCARKGSGYVYQKPQTDWSGVTANAITGALATYMGYQQNKMVTEANAELGWPTQSY